MAKNQQQQTDKLKNNNKESFDTDRRTYYLDQEDDPKWTMGSFLYLPWCLTALPDVHALNYYAQTYYPKWPLVDRRLQLGWLSQPAIKLEKKHTNFITSLIM